MGLATLFLWSCVLPCAAQSASPAPSKRYQELIQQVQRQIQQNPTNPRFPTILGRLYQRGQEYKKAQKQYRKALTLRPNYVHARVGLAHIALQRRQLPQAYQLLQSILKRKPSHVPALVELSEYYRLRSSQSNKPKEQKAWLHKAIQTLQQAVRLRPKHHRYPFRLGLLYLAAERSSEARLSFISALARSPQRPCYRLGLQVSEALLTQNRKNSYAPLKTAAKQCKHPLLHGLARRLLLALATEIAQNLMQQSKRKQAVAFFRRVLQEHPRNVEGQLFLVYLLYQVNQCQEAKQVLKTILRWAPQHKLAKKLLNDPNYSLCHPSSSSKPRVHTEIQILKITPKRPKPRRRSRSPN